MNPPAETPDAQPASIEASKLGVLRLIAWLLVAGPLAFLSALFLFLPTQPLQAVGPLLILVLAALCLLVIRRGRPVAATLLLIYGGLSAVVLHALVSGAGIHTPQLAAMPLGIMLAGWLLGRRHAIAITALSVAFSLALALLEQSGLAPAQLNLPAMLVWLPRAVVAVGVCLLTLFIVDTYEQQLAEVHRLGQALAEEHAQLREIAESVPAMIAYNDTELVLRYANRQYMAFFGLDPDTSGGRPVRDIIGPAAFETARPLLQRTLEGERVRYRAARRNVAGEVRTIEVETVPDRDHDGRVRGAYALMRDVTEQERAEAALKAAYARFEAVIEHTPAVAIQGFTEDGTVLHWNHASADLYGIAADKAIGRRLQDLLHTPEDAAAFLETVAGIYRSGRATEPGEWPVTLRDGRRLFVFSTMVPVFEDGKVAEVFCMDVDVTERRRAEAAVQRLNEALEERVRQRTADLTAANRELESFAYSISHDLRAPLRGIDGFAHLLVEEYGERLDAQGHGYLERVRRAAQRMGNLIDDILELSRVTRQEMRRSRVDLSRIATELLDERARSEPGGGARLRVAPGCTALGDPQLLRVLLQNLLENAWKYSARCAAPEIEFGRCDGNGEAVFFVRDNGVGFDMQYAAKLFSPFQRLHSPEEFEGTGIGLATVARVVERHGGRVWAEAAVGKGATFRFTLGEHAE